MLRIRSNVWPWLLAAMIGAGQASASTLIVTSNADSGAGSLRSVVSGAIANDIVTFAPEVTGKIVLTSGQIAINKPLTISGPGAKALAVSGNNSSRIFNINDGNPTTDSPVVISGLSLVDGYAGSCAGVPVSSSGGALNTNESLTLTDVSVRGSFASSNGGGLSFAPTRTGQTLTIQSSEFLSNIAGCSGAASNAAAGGLNLSVDAAADPALSATILIEDTLIQGNVSVRNGAGLRLITPGSATLHNVRIRGNSAVNAGGGLMVSYSTSPVLNSLPTLLIDSCEISGNSSGNGIIGGGGILATNDFAAAQTSGSGSTVTIRNSTISGNQARGGPGGGITAYGNTAVVLQNTTVANNGAVQVTAAPSEAGGVYRSIGVQSGTATANTEGTLSITSSILANNRGTIGMEDLGQNPSETFVNAIVLNNSLVRTTGTITPTPSGSGNLSVDPLLLPLANYGGPTLTHALAASSPAIDAGSNPASVTTDQRGFARPVGAAVDMGAFEFGNVIPLGCLDADGNGEIGALTDGLLIMRAMFGLTGNSAINNAIGGSASRNTWSAIRAFLNGNCGSTFAL